MNRIDRLTSIIVMLQSQRYVSAIQISEKYNISKRTVFRDLKALEEGGVPIAQEPGRGYYIVEGYNLPPVMFSKEEAGAILIGEKLSQQFADRSSHKAYKSATDKIKAVLPEEEKGYWEQLDASTHILHQPRAYNSDFPNHFISSIQNALHQKKGVLIEYYAHHNQSVNKRIIEPLSIIFYGNVWHVIAWCRMRKDYRDFRIDRIKKLSLLDDCFNEHTNFSINDLFKRQWEDAELLPARIIVSNEGYTGLTSSKYYYGLVSENAVDNGNELHFLTKDYSYFANWVLSLGTMVKAVGPEELLGQVQKRIENARKIFFQNNLNKVT